MSVEKNDATGAELERQNGVLNRFEEALDAFREREGLSAQEAWNVLMASAAHRLGHAGGAKTDDEFDGILGLFVDRALSDWLDHKRDCLGGADGRQHDH